MCRALLPIYVKNIISNMSLLRENTRKTANKWPRFNSFDAAFLPVVEVPCKKDVDKTYQ